MFIPGEPYRDSNHGDNALDADFGVRFRGVYHVTSKCHIYHFRHYAILDEN